MTKIELFIRGAEADAAIDGPLTGGMVGVQVEIRYNGAWDGLNKTLVCRSCVDGSPIQAVRTVANIDTQATVAHEVMIPGRTLYLGVEGRNADGTVVFPTVWACCGTIRPGANATADPTVEATPEVWEQLMAQLGTPDTLKTNSKNTLVAAINETVEQLQDIRTGRDGTVYDSAGHAVRHQLEDVYKAMEQLEQTIPEEKDGEDASNVSWNDLKDKPFTVECITILEEKEYDFETSEEGVVDLPAFPELTDGEEYIVVVNGVEYECEYYYDEFMGDGSLFRQDMPIHIVQYYPTDEYLPNAVIQQDAQMGKYTIGIKQYVYNTLDEKYLPYKTEEWSFTMEDGSVVVKQVVVK